MIFVPKTMRQVHNPQPSFNEIPIPEIVIDPVSRDDIPAVLKGLQHLYCDEELRQQAFKLLEDHVFLPAGEEREEGSPRIDPGHGRPGLDLWQVLVLAVVKHAINCDFDRLAELANEHSTLRRMLGLTPEFCDRRFQQRTLVRNVSLLTPPLLSEMNTLVVRAGLRVAGKQEGEPLQGRADSFAVESNAHYPTDVNLLWDAERKLLAVLGAVCGACGVEGWRQWEHWTKRVRRLYQAVSTWQRRKGKRGKRRVRCYLRVARRLVKRAEETLPKLAARGVKESVREEIEAYLEHARRQIDQIDRRVLKNQVIPHEEKVFSIFEPFTRWIQKGKLGVLVELGVPVAVLECREQFILHWEVMWEGEDVHVAVPLVEGAQEKFPELEECSFDRNFHSPGNRKELDGKLAVNALPKKGKLSKAEQKREKEPKFRAARKAHAAVESAINNLEQRGLDRVLSRGAAGFERTVGLAVLAANVHRIGLLLQRAERERRKRERKRRQRALLKLAA